MGKIISVNNNKGGVSKTSTCIELAACLGDYGKKVLLVDFDQQTNLSDYTESSEEKKTIVDFIDALAEERDDITSNDIIQKMKFYDLIAGSPELATADLRWGNIPNKEYLLIDALEMLREMYDYIIIDNAPSRNLTTNMSLIAADYVLIPTEVDDGSLKGLTTVVADVVKLNNAKHADYEKKEILAFVLNRYEKTKMHKDTLDLLDEQANELPEKPIVAMIRKGIVISEAKTVMKSVQEIDKYSNIALDYRKLAKEIIRKVEA